MPVKPSPLAWQSSNLAYHKIKWKHALEEGLGTIKKGLEIYQTGKALFNVGRVVIPMLL